MGAASLASLVSRPVAAAPSAKLGEARVISHLAHRYHGWPTSYAGSDASASPLLIRSQAMLAQIRVGAVDEVLLAVRDFEQARIEIGAETDLEQFHDQQQLEPVRFVILA